MSASFTPGPWSVVFDACHYGNRRIVGPGNSAVAKVYGDEPTALDKKGGANAEFIVRACNSHDELLAALEQIAAHSCAGLQSLGVDRASIREIARAAIAKARGQ